MDITAQTYDDIVDKGLEIYNSRLKTILEPDHNNEYVVINVEDGDFAVGRSRVAAMRTMRHRHSADSKLVGLKIGEEPDYGLAARILAAQGDPMSQK